jgi:hypothetical protein
VDGFLQRLAHEKEILQVTQLDRLWPICQSRVEALEAVKRDGFARGGKG